MFGKSNGPRQMNYLWVLAGGYLAYLGYNLLKSCVTGQAANPFIFGPIGLLFLVVGVLLCLREWKLYRYGPAPDNAKDTADDPDLLENGVFDSAESEDNDDEELDDLFLEETVLDDEDEI